MANLESCGNCHYAGDLDQKTDGGLRLVFCQRYPPTLIKENGEFKSYQPTLDETAWCGEWKRKYSASDLKDG